MSYQKPPPNDRRKCARRLDWLQAEGKVADEIRARDWSQTILGPLDEWPTILRSTLNLVLNSDLSMFVGWGEDLLCFYNDAYAPLLQGRGEALGHPLGDVFPEAAPSVGPLFAKALQGEATFRESFSIPLLRDAVVQETWWTVSYSPIFEEGGGICGVFVPVHEITRQLEAVAQLRTSEENRRIFSNLVPSLLWRANPDGENVWINQRMRDFFGESDPWEAVHPEDRPSLEGEWTRAKHEGNTFHHCHRVKSPDGTYRWHVAISEPRTGSTGTIQEWCGVATDVHDLRLAADAVEESSALFRRFASNSADMIWVADAVSGRFEYLSPAFHAIWGPSPPAAELTWDYWLSTVHPDDRLQQEQSFERLQAGEVLNEQYRILRPDGTVRWIRDTMFPIFTAGGAIYKIGGIAQDITRQNGQIVHLVDGGPESRNALAQRLQALGYQVRPFATVAAFLRVSRALLPGCVVFLDRGDDAEAERLASGVKGNLQSLPVVMVCDVKNASRAISLMKQGVCDIVLPSDPPEHLEQAVATALAQMQTGTCEDNAVRNAKEQVQQLTEREREVLEGLSEGATNKMLARDLGVSPRTVETYRVRLLEKLGVPNLPQAVKIAALSAL